jgi:glycyl-tRNA synthetase alpha subunit
MVALAAPTFQDTIRALEGYWADYGCVLMQPYHTEVAAGTMNPATFLRSLGSKPWKTAYVEPVIRPLDGRYGENPYRFQHYFQYQVVIKPAPENVLDLYFASLEAIGIDLRRHDVRLVEDDWEQPTLGAWGLGWEVWCDGMEVTQWTYFQQLGGFDVELVPAEITYGLERLAMFLQGKRSALELEWAPGITWGDVYPRERARVVGLQLRARADRRADEAFRRARGGVPAAARAAPAAAGVRPGLEGLAHVQPPRRAGRSLRDRAGRLHRPCTQPRARGAQVYLELEADGDVAA